ncbi:hypothetical protein [Lysobacter sp. D1-1-M9]|uniref:hypothetical protein n=3 Tax=Novilysobacter TaxID=3382699 RepID=UPI002FC6B0C3
MDRRWFHPRSGLLALLLYAAVAALTLGANPFKGETITPFDVLVSQRAWEFVDPEAEVRSYQRSDILNALLPQWEVAKKQLQDGQVPLWNDKVAGGGTFLSLNTNLFTPAFAIFAVTPDPALGFYLGTLFNLALAGLGMHLFLRRHVGAPAAIIGAITFELCGFNAAWLYWPHVLTLIWAPWLLWAIDRCAHRPGAGNSLLVAASSALVWLGGFPFLSVLVIEMAGLYALVLLITRWRSGDKPWRFAAWCLAGTGLGLLLAALPVLGLLYWLQQFDLGYREGRGSYLDLGHWKQLFPPWAYQVQRVEQTMYVGASMMALAAVALAAFLATVLRRRGVRPLPLFGVLVVAITAGLVFELWPMWLIGWLPGMTFNSWSRAIGLLDIGLVILGALGLDLLWRAARRKPLRIALVAIGLVQVIEISMFFRDFNGPVDADYYFPRTASIEYVRERAGPFDYVITDKSFVMSGTLGVYGQREWLAHYFRIPALQDALHEMAKRPFNSHRASASRFPASHIKYDAPAMADYNVRYALIDSRHGPGTPERIEVAAIGEHVALPAMPEHSYLQHFKLPEATALLGLSVRLATYRKSKLPGRVTLQVLDAGNHAVAEAAINAAQVKDNTYMDFHFTQPVTLAAGDYAFSLAYEPREPGSWRLTAWAFEAPDPATGLSIDREPFAGTIQYQLLAQESGGSAFRRVFMADGTVVLENGDHPGGPYFIADLQDGADSLADGTVQVTRYRSDAFTLRYVGDTSGYVIVPMSMTGDWRVTVDGAPVEPSLKHGVMPAVRVSAPATIRFEYRPELLRWLWPWLAAVAAALLAMAWASRWTTRPAR